MPFTPFKKGHKPTPPQKKVPPGPIPQTPNPVGGGKGPTKGPFGQELDNLMQKPPAPAKKKSRKGPPAGPKKTGY